MAKQKAAQGTSPPSSPPPPPPTPSPTALSQSLTVLTGNLLTLGILAIIYLNYLLFCPYITAFLLALTLSSLLRSCKNQFTVALERIVGDDMSMIRMGYYWISTSDVTTLTCYPIPVFIGLSILTLLPTFPHLYVFLPLLLATAAALVYLLDRKLIFLPIQTLAILQAVTLFVVVAVFICCYLTLSLYDGMTGILSIGKYLQTQSTTSPYLTAAYDANVDKLKGAACEFYNGVREEQWWGIVEGVGGGMFEGSGEDCVFKLLDLEHPLSPPIPLTEIVASLPTTLNVTAAITAVKTTFTTDEILTAVVSAVTVLANVFGNISDVIIQTIMFVTFLIVLLQSSTDTITRVIFDQLPSTSTTTKHDVTDAIKHGLHSVLMLPLRLAAAHAVVFTTILTASQCSHVRFSTLLAFLHSVAPIAPSYLICFPWILELVVKERYGSAVLALVTIKVAIGSLDDIIYASHLTTLNPVFTSLSLLLGFRAFGSIGVLLGPLCLTAGSFAYGALRETKEAESGGAKKGKKGRVVERIRSGLGLGKDKEKGE